MKKAIVIFLLSGICMPVMAQDFRAPMRRGPQPRQAKEVQKPGPGGAVVDGVRKGNPLQLINPLAPGEYGTGEEYVYHSSETDPGTSATCTPPNRKRALGIKLFAILW